MIRRCDRENETFVQMPFVVDFEETGGLFSESSKEILINVPSFAT